MLNAASEVSAERRLRDQSLALGSWSLPAPHDLTYLQTAIDAQARVFMSDMFQQMVPYLRGLPWGTRLQILDVGAGSAAGSAWLADVLSGAFLGVSASVDALEANPIYTDYATIFFPQVRYVSGKLLHDLPPDQTWDIVLASHVIEHVDDPEGFIEQLRNRATRRAFIYAPFNEPVKNRAVGHVHSYSEGTIQGWRPLRYTLVKSLGWRKDVGDTNDQCFFAEFTGTAK